MGVATGGELAGSRSSAGFRQEGLPGWDTDEGVVLVLLAISLLCVALVSDSGGPEAFGNGLAVDITA